MAIEYSHKPEGGPRVIMTACPLCGHEFQNGEQKAVHFLREHTADDV